MATAIIDLLGGEAVLGPGVRSELDLARATRNGLPLRAADRIRTTAGIARPLDGAHFDERRLTPAESDAIVRIARVLARAIDVLGDQSKAAHWVNTPNQALGGEIPLTLLDTSSGEHEVEALLDRIEYGVYS